TSKRSRQSPTRGKSRRTIGPSAVTPNTTASKPSLALRFGTCACWRDSTLARFSWRICRRTFAVDEDDGDRAAVVVVVSHGDGVTDSLGPAAAKEGKLARPTTVPAHGVQDLPCLRSRVRVQDGRSLPEHRFLGVAEEALGAWVPVDDPSRQIDHDHGIEDVLDGSGVPTEDFLQARPIGHVPKAPNPTHDGPSDLVRL